MITLETTAFTLGLLGSLHCVGMCGPIVLSLPFAGLNKSAAAVSSFYYHAGRTLTYACLGFVTGCIGYSFAIAGISRWLSVGLGMAILLVLLLPSRFLAIPNFPSAILQRSRQQVHRLLATKQKPSLFILGMLNGFLPCGMLYAALAGALAATSPVNSAAFMAIFGAGTFPLMFMLTFTGSRLRTLLRKSFSKIYPVMLGCMAITLIIRGMDISVPGFHWHIHNKKNAIECKK